MAAGSAEGSVAPTHLQGLVRFDLDGRVARGGAFRHLNQSWPPAFPKRIRGGGPRSDKSKSKRGELLPSDAIILLVILKCEKTMRARCTTNPKMSRLTYNLIPTTSKLPVKLSPIKCCGPVSFNFLILGDLPRVCSHHHVVLRSAGLERLHC